MNDLAERYLACRNETDAARRSELIAEGWTSDATYLDPLMEVAGREQLTAAIGAVHEQFPGFVFTQVGEVDAHHNIARFQWGLGQVGAEPVVVGFDVIVVDDNGRIRSVNGFLDKIPG